MNERLLQYIWQFQYFNQASLCTTAMEPLQIVHPGIYNTNQGPDFSAAKIRIGNTTWAGNIELHVNSSDWERHKHTADKNYGNVILHVVWRHDIPDTAAFPTLVLEDRISKLLLRKYDELMKQPAFIPCEKNISSIDALSWSSWKERLLVERLEQRSGTIIKFLEQNNYHWEETCWWMLARNFGVQQNGDAFEKMARSISVKILAKHRNRFHQVEALLMGQAGLLDHTFSEDYPLMLQKEYLFLKYKYQLTPVQHPLYFLRMRPANFPTLRLAQLAMLLHRHHKIFTQVCESGSLQFIKKLLDVTANDYWHYHYVFDEPAAFKEKKLGTQMMDNIIINTIAPLIFTYGLYHKNEVLMEKAVHWLQSIAAEKNNIIKGFETLGIVVDSAFDSQALLQLKNEYCNKKHCLDCVVGNKLLKK